MGTANYPLRRRIGWAWLVIIGLFAPTLAAQERSTTRPATATEPVCADAANLAPPADRRQVVLFQPVVLADDEGMNSARVQLPKSTIDNLLETAECLYLEPSVWRQRSVLRGELPLDMIVKQATEQHWANADRRVIPLLFVSAIEGDAKPAVRRAADGRIRVVCLGDATTPEATVLELLKEAHRVGPNEKSESGVGPIDRVLFHTLEDGRRLLTDETWEPYTTEAPDDMIRFSLGLKADDPLPLDPAARRAFIAEKYGEQVLEFTDEERDVLRRVVERLAEKTGQDWPLVSRQPWHFIKVRSTFCRGMAHTRGLAIVFSEGNLRRLSADEPGAMKLLLHEKLHVLQRVYAARFAPLYRELGWVPVTLVPGEDRRLNIAQNPDALQLNWARAQGDTQLLLVTLLSRRNDGQFAFQSQLRLLEGRDGGRVAIGEKAPSMAEFEAWQQTFAVRSGFDHPNELTAYLSSVLLDADYLKPRSATDTTKEQPTLQVLRRGFTKSLKLVAD